MISFMGIFPRFFAQHIDVKLESTMTSLRAHSLVTYRYDRSKNTTKRAGIMNDNI